jgi:hypothetical protein
MTDKDLFLRYSDLKKKHDDSLKENEDKWASKEIKK